VRGEMHPRKTPARRWRRGAYDRLFPNQDTMPKGGLGNLIALPLQAIPRKNGNSVFVDEFFLPYKDQWEYLSTIQKLSESSINSIVRRVLMSTSKRWRV
jgi:hypothetical protein